MARAQGRGAQLGDMIAALDRCLRADPPAVVVVQGDTTSALAGALADLCCAPTELNRANLRTEAIVARSSCARGRCCR